MSDLAAVAVGGGIGVASALLATFTQARLRLGEFHAEVREKRRSEAASLAGPAVTVLRDLDPNANVGVLRGNPRAQEALQEKWKAWLTAQGKLDVLGAMHPDSEVSALCEQVVTRGTTLLGRLHFAITGSEVQTDAWWNEVEGLRDQALANARRLVTAVLEQP